MKTTVVIALTAIFILAASLFYEARNNHSPLLKEEAARQDNGMSLEDFNKKINNPKKIVLVYFNADWCLPCVKLKPSIEHIEKEYADIVDVLELDVDKNPKLALHFEINTLPMFMIYKQGKKVWEYNSFISRDELLNKIRIHQAQ